jgi:hypothetical protein
MAVRQLRLDRDERAVLADVGQLRVHCPGDRGVDLAGEFDGGLCAGPSSLCGQEVARQLPGFGTHLSIRNSCPARLYSGARHGTLGFVLGVILPQIAFNLGFAIVLLQGFFAELPNELFEAAFVDGCSYPRMFWQITMPLSRPILATVGVLSLVGSWNEYLLPLVMINNEALYPWPLGIMQYQGQYGTDWGKVLAFVSLTLAPAVIFYLMAQKHIIAGLTSGAVKG